MFGPKKNAQDRRSCVNCVHRELSITDVPCWTCIRGIAFPQDKSKLADNWVPGDDQNDIQKQD